MSKSGLKLLAFFLFLIFLCDSAIAGNKTVVVVNSYNRDFKWVEEHNGILKRGLAGKADVFYHYLDSKRLSKEQSARNVEAVKVILDEQRPDVVVLTDDFALKSLGQFLANRDISVVYLGINGNARGYVDNVRKITGVLERPLVKRSILYLKEIIGPDMDKCLVLMDDSLSSRVFVRENMRGRLSFDVSGVRTNIKLIKSIDNWKDAVRAAPAEGYPCIVIGLYHIFRDEHGRHIPSNEVLAWTSKFSAVPVFGLWSFSVGKGKAVGGYVLSGIDQGREALKMVKSILAGDNAENISPVIGRNGRLLFSAPEMKRWKIKLPDTITSKGYLIRVIR